MQEFFDRRRRIIFLLLQWESHAGVLWGSWTEEEEFFFLLLHTQFGGSYIMPEKHDRPAESHAGVLVQKMKNFFLLLHTQDGRELHYA